MGDGTAPEGRAVLQAALPQLLVELHCVTGHGGCTRVSGERGAGDEF